MSLNFGLSYELARDQLQTTAGLETHISHKKEQIYPKYN